MPKPSELLPMPDPLPIGSVLLEPCIECGRDMLLKTGRYGFFWGCSGWPGCGGVLGAHSATGIPLGKQADFATRRARVDAHDSFDPLWKSGRMGRSTAYQWLASRLGVPLADCHIGNFDLSMCRRVVEVVKSFADEQVPDTQGALSRRERKKRRKKLDSRRRAASRKVDSCVALVGFWGGGKRRKRKFRTLDDE